MQYSMAQRFLHRKGAALVVVETPGIGHLRENQRKNAIVGADKKLPIVLHANKRHTLLAVVDSDEVDGAGREARVGIFQNKSTLHDVVRFDIVCDVNDSELCRLLQQRPFQQGNVVVVQPEVGRQGYYLHGKVVLFTGQVLVAGWQILGPETFKAICWFLGIVKRQTCFG